MDWDSNCGKISLLSQGSCRSQLLLIQFCLFRLQSRGRCVHIGGSEHALECGVLHRLEDGADVGREPVHRWRSISLWQQPFKGGGCRILGGGSRPACHTVVFYCAPTFSALTRLVFARDILDGCSWIAASVPNIRLCWVRWQVVEEKAFENSPLALQLDLFLLELSCDIKCENFSRIIAAIKG